MFGFVMVYGGFQLAESRHRHDAQQRHLNSAAAPVWADSPIGENHSDASPNRTLSAPKGGKRELCLVRIWSVGESALVRVLRDSSDAGIRFDDLCALLRRLGFAERIRGSHHIFNRDGVDEILNLQPRGSMAKPYQVKQVRRVLVQYKLAEEGQ